MVWKFCEGEEERVLWNMGISERCGGGEGWWGGLGEGGGGGMSF